MKAIEIELMQTNYHVWLTFRDSVDVENKFTGRVYRDPTFSSLQRVAVELSKLPVRIRLDSGGTPILYFDRRID
ncbi:MAG: hypothetical protein UY48_C0001G0055 [Candidatus Gottesmanbacteria bacterium GW2011_GWB1_49_7]|uniref:Uncharacterized protein n=1 Tax=Candidatus Gottesmanbacteria bacterium GW2011_GWB1_49_7 TaxID=1618448 RepID=A0A0G1Z3R3_9BACT|nr:MAG: hypothetical protein UY48_C0001G0055 [Candidatus Gottesmanbacteria bacterium GW2011_GWB1_49_7]